MTEQPTSRGPKTKNGINRVRAIIDYDAKARDEPGLTHSFVASLATAIDCAGYVADPVQLMGASGFAFRIWIEERLLPNAMNGFDWQAILPQAVEHAGFSCTHIHRFEQEFELEEQRRRAAYEGIVASIDRGVPAIVWDPADPPMWGLITGYNDHSQSYSTSAFWGYAMPLDYASLGRRDVNRLSVILLGDPLDFSEQDMLRGCLESALLHSQGGEGRQLPDVQSGLAAYDRWAQLMEPGGLAEHELQFADYYAEMFYAFRCYARDFLQVVAGNEQRLLDASSAYAAVADALRSVYLVFREQRCPQPVVLESVADHIRAAKQAERRALACIEAYLTQPKTDVAPAKGD